MKLLRCHIVGFGKLNDFSYEFTDGLGIINEKNGWGKSTLAAFIKAMLYGFPSYNGKDLGKNERLRYTPWSGGKFGGSLEFSYRKKEYRIERFFERNNDSFLLWDLSSNTQSKDFSEKVGEDIFQIDVGGYERSTYVSDRTEADRDNTTVKAKLGAFLEDVKNSAAYDAAAQRLDTEGKRYKNARGNGLIADTEEKINEKTKELLDAAEAEKIAKVKEGRYEDLSEALKEKRKELEQVRLDVKRADAAEKDRQATLMRQTHERRKKEVSAGMAELLGRYGGSMPEAEVVIRIESLLRKKAEASVKTENTEKELSVKAEQEEDFSDCDRISALAKSLEDTRKAQGEVADRVTRLSAGEFPTSRFRRAQGKKLLYPVITCLVVAIVCFIAGGVTLSKLLPLGIGLMVLGGFMLFSAGFIGYHGIINDRLVKIAREEEEERLKEAEKALIIELKGLCTEHGYSSEDFSAVAEELNAKRERSRWKAEAEKERISALREEYNKCTAQLKNISDELKGIIDGYGSFGDAGEFLETAKRDAVLFERLCAEQKKSEQEEELFGKEEAGATEILAPQDKLALEIKERRLSSAVESLLTELTKSRAEADKYRELSATQSDIEEEITELNEKLRDYKRKLKVISYTVALLKKAKDNLSVKYLKPMTDSFFSYIKRFFGDKFKSSVITSNFDIFTEEYGVRRSLDYFSHGTKDVMELCMRFALIDALFTEDKPFVILDDPFVSLDDENRETALSVVKEIAKEYQIIYFVCSGSRI